MEKAYDRVWKDGLRLKLQKSGVTGCMYQWISQYLTNRKAPSPREWNLQPQEDTERRSPSGRRLEPYLIPCLHQWHCQRHASQSPGSHIRRRSGPVVLGGTPFNSKLQNAAGAEHLGRLDKPVACKNQFQEDHLYHLQPFNKGTEGHPVYQRPDSACWGQPHLPGGDFRQAADLETTDRKGWSQSQGATCPHEEVGRHDMGSRYCDSQATVYWWSQTSTWVRNDSMGHYSQVQVWSGQQSTEPGNPHHHRGHEVNADSGAGNSHRAPVTWWTRGFQTATLGCQIQEVARPLYEAEIVPASRGDLRGQESTSSTQEVKKTKSASLPAYTTQTIKLKQKPWKHQQPTLKSALTPLSVLSSLWMPCPYCRSSSQLGTLTCCSCLYLQKPCGHPAVDSLSLQRASWLSGKGGHDKRASG